MARCTTLQTPKKQKPVYFPFNPTAKYFSQVSSLLNSLYKLTAELTFEKCPPHSRSQSAKHDAYENPQKLHLFVCCIYLCSFGSELTIHTVYLVRADFWKVFFHSINTSAAARRKLEIRKVSSLLNKLCKTSVQADFWENLPRQQHICSGPPN